MKITRHWAMPNHETFKIKPIAELLKKYSDDGDVIIDPFARNSMVGTHRNDLNPNTTAQWHLDAGEFCEVLNKEKVVADVVLFDPPYSPRQVKECYEGIGLEVRQKDTQLSRMYKVVKSGLTELLRPGGLAISFGWNSSGFPKTKGFERIETMLVCHGSTHYDTIVCVDRKPLVDMPSDRCGEVESELYLAV